MHLFVTPGPEWFSGPDFIVDLVSVLVLLLIGFFSWKYYIIDKTKKHLHLFVAMVILGISFLFKIFTYFLLYLTTFNVQIYQTLGRLIYYVEPSNFYFSIAFITYSLLTLIGFFILYSIYEQNISIKTTILTLYFMLALAIFSENAYIFMHLTALILTLMIAHSLWRNCKKNKLKSTMWLATSFLILSISRIFFILANLNPSMYVLGELIQLFGYIILLLIFISVLQHGKKKGKNTNN
ncbi:MAG: hypothetical protein WC758_02655 [Candidatus Woesearchaeota archaeon]|jgi:hypothetical protein